MADTAPSLGQRHDGLREKVEQRLSGMKSVRQDMEEEWRQIARFATPSRSRFLGTTTDSQKDSSARRRTWNKRLLDPHGIEAFRTLTNGMTSGLSSASRPWFKLKLDDEAVNEADGVREWLDEVEKLIYARLAATNFYGAVKSGYQELGLFGTEACVMEEHPSALAVCHALTAGEYWIALSDALVADTLYRICPMSARQMVQKFGSSVSPEVRRLYDGSNYDHVVTCYHAIEPNDDHQPGRLGSKPWRSVYWEQGNDKRELLRVSGFEEQPFWAPRWDVCGGDVYGNSPAMDALPAMRELQMQSKRLNETIDQLVKPELVTPAGLRLTGEPGRKVTGTGFTRDQVFAPHEVNYQAIQAIGERITAQREQIDGLSYADLFNAITNMRGIQPRNVEEIASRNEEKLTQLGPVVERLWGEKLEPAIDRMFGILLRGGLLPEIPEALRGRKINVELISILAQMQRMVGLGQIERTAGFVGNLAAANPEALDKLDVDEMIDEYADRAGAPPKMIRSTEDVAKLRASRAQQQQMAQMAEMAPAVKDAVGAAQLLSETDAHGQSLLDRVMPA
jgi:hypothetical protein